MEPPVGSQSSFGGEVLGLWGLGSRDASGLGFRGLGSRV